jgi:hypothetical protein
MAKVERCPKCGAMKYDPFFTSIQVHWTDKCNGIAPPAPEPKVMAKAVRIRRRPSSISAAVPCDEIDELAKYICDQMTLDYFEFKPTGWGDCLLARQIYCAVRNEQQWKHQAIGDEIGRVRTTVIHALSMHKKMIARKTPQAEFYRRVYANALAWCQYSGGSSNDRG